MSAHLSQSLKVMTMMAVALMLGACQTAPPMAKPAVLDDSAFMKLWMTYRHCESGGVVDLDTMRVDAMHLNAAAHYPEVRVGHELPLPKAIQRWVSEPANRLAVDPKAMAVACSLHTGQAALSVGKYDLAREMFRVVVDYPEGTYPYYVSQARAALAQLSTEATFSGITAPALSYTARLVSTAATK